MFELNRVLLWFVYLKLKYTEVYRSILIMVYYYIISHNNVNKPIYPL